MVAADVVQATGQSQPAPQSAFAKALANKKLADSDEGGAGQASGNPFHVSVSSNESGNNAAVRTEDLEVVDEDFREDRNSMASSAAKSFAARPSTQSQLPMKRDTFVAQFSGVLTQQEREELRNL